MNSLILLRRWKGLLGTLCAGMLLLFATQTLFAAGTGIIRGRITDRDSKDALPGANVLVKKTSLGASANLDGSYVIYNVPVGEQTLQVTFVGYSPVTITVTVQENKPVFADVAMQVQTILGQTVVVTAQAKGQMQAINQQLASDKIASIVSEARIQELPDFNAAQAISRLPGVSTLQSSGEANKVVIRGLAPQFNKIAVGGISLASTGSTSIGITSLGGGYINQDRSVDVSMITPYMIKSISVYKTLTPDMNANAIGGLVDMELREAPDGLHGDLLWQSGYTNKTGSYGNYRVVASGSDRFLDGRLGIYLLGNAEQYDRASDNMSASYAPSSIVVRPDGFKPVTVQSVTLTRHIEVRKRFGGNAIFDYALPSGSIRSVNMFSRLQSDAHDYQTQLHYGDGASGNIDFTYTNSAPKTDLAINTLEFANDFSFMSVNLKVANTYSRNFSINTPQYQFRETGGINTGGAAITDTPPEQLVPRIFYGGPGSVMLNNVNLFSADYKENDQVYKGDFKVPVPLGNKFAGYVKAGGEFRYNYHTNAQATPYLELRRGGSTSSIATAVMDSIRAHFPVYYDSATARFPGSNFTSTDQDLYKTFLGDRFGQILWIADPRMINGMIDYSRYDPAFSAAEANATNPGGWYDGPFQHLPNNYKYIEKYYAGFLMGEVSFNQNLTVVGGVRYEQVKSLFATYNLIDGRNPLTQNVFPVTVYPQNHYLLPMVQAKYSVNEWLDTRYAYTVTLARPDYTQLSPHITMSNDRLNVFAGNPKLKPAHSYGHDLQVTVHNNELGLITLGGFYKIISGFTYFTTYKLHMSYDPVTRQYFQIPAGLDSVGSFQIGGTVPNNGANLNTYINSPYKAYVKGLEADVQTRFWYLPKPFDGLLMGVNYTHIWSKATYPWRDDRTILVGRQLITKTIDSTRTGRLIFQPNDVVNAYLGYDFKGFSGRLSFIFQGNSVSNIGNFAEQDGFTKDYFRVDASARQMLPIEGLQIFLDLNNLNARQNQSAQASIGAFTNQQNYGLVANLGVRYTL